MMDSKEVRATASEHDTDESSSSEEDCVDELLECLDRNEEFLRSFKRGNDIVKFQEFVKKNKLANEMHQHSPLPNIYTQLSNNGDSIFKDLGLTPKYKESSKPPPKMELLRTESSKLPLYKFLRSRKPMQGRVKKDLSKVSEELKNTKPVISSHSDETSSADDKSSDENYKVGDSCSKGETEGVDIRNLSSEEIHKMLTLYNLYQNFFNPKDKNQKNKVTENEDNKMIVEDVSDDKIEQQKCENISEDKDSDNTSENETGKKNHKAKSKNNIKDSYKFMPQDKYEDYTDSESESEDESDETEDEDLHSEAENFLFKLPIVPESLTDMFEKDENERYENSEIFENDDIKIKINKEDPVAQKSLFDVFFLRFLSLDSEIENRKSKNAKKINQRRIKNVSGTNMPVNYARQICQDTVNIEEKRKQENVSGKCKCEPLNFIERPTYLYSSGKSLVSHIKEQVSKKHPPKCYVRHNEDSEDDKYDYIPECLKTHDSHENQILPKDHPWASRISDSFDFPKEVQQMIEKRRREKLSKDSSSGETSQP